MKDHTRWLRQRALARKLMRIAMWLAAAFVLALAINLLYPASLVKALGWAVLSFSFMFLRVGFTQHIKLYEDFCAKAILPFANELQKELPSFPVYVPRLRAVFFAKNFHVLEEGFKKDLRERFWKHRRHVAQVARLKRAKLQQARLALSHAEIDVQLIDLAMQYGQDSARGNVAYKAIGQGKLGEKRRLAQMLSGPEPEQEREEGRKAARFMAQFQSLAKSGADARALALFMSAAETLDMDERLELLKVAIDLQRAANQRPAKSPKIPAKPRPVLKPAVRNQRTDLYAQFVRKVPVAELLAGTGLNLAMASELLFRLAKDRVFGERYKQLEDIRGDIARSFRSAHGQNFSPRDFKRLLAWLLKNGVVLEWKNGQTISLSPHATARMSEPCQKLVAALVQFDREFH